MPTDHDLSSLDDFLRRARTTNLIVVSDGFDDELPPVIERLQIHEDIGSDFLEVARRAVPSDGALSLREYDPGYKPEPNELTFVRLSDLGGIGGLVSDVQRVHNADLFQEDEEVIENLRFYAIVVGSGERQAVFFRGYSPKKELQRHAAFALMLKRGHYNRVQNKVFLFDSSVDCFSWDGILYIKNAHQFQRIFGYFEALREKGKETVQSLNQRAPIQNYDEFLDVCTGHALMLAKLASIARKPYLNRIGISDLKGTISRFSLPVEVADQDGQEMLVFDPSPQKRWLLLKLFDDDFLDSEMTNQKYEVNSKVRM